VKKNNSTKNLTLINSHQKAFFNANNPTHQKTPTKYSKNNNKKAFLNANTQTKQKAQNKKDNDKKTFLNASTNKTKIKPHQNQIIKPKITNGYKTKPQHKTPTKHKPSTPKLQENNKRKKPPLQTNPYQHTKTKPITLPNKNVKKHQTNTKLQISHLKRARPTGLAPVKQHNITDKQKTHIIGHKNINTPKIQLTNVQNNYKHKVNKQKYQISHQNYEIRTRILSKNITRNKCLYTISYQFPRTKTYQSCLHSNYNHTSTKTYLPKPHKKTPKIVYHPETYYPIYSPSTKLYACDHTNKNNHDISKEHSTPHKINTILSKNKQNIKLNKQPTLYPYITTYNIPTYPPPTQYQITKINK
jgi:hypothetical protein